MKNNKFLTKRTLTCLKQTLVLAGLSLSLSVNAAPVLFAVTGYAAMAENLSYGPNIITEASSPYLSTQEANTVHDVWYQNFTSDGSTTLFDISWQFSTEKSLAQRFSDAVNFGESVTWTVNYGATTSTISGAWWFSDGAGSMGSKFAGSGANFSDDDGFWGAGDVVQANLGNGGSWENLFYGVGNLDGSDDGPSLFINGSFHDASLVGHKNYMYIGSPSAVPVPAAAWLFGSALAGLGVVRHKK